MLLRLRSRAISSSHAARGIRGTRSRAPPPAPAPPRASGTQLPLLQKKLSALNSPLPLQNRRETGPLGTSRSTSWPWKALWVGLQVVFRHSKTLDFHPSLELELQKGNLGSKVIEKRNRNPERFTPGASLSAAKTPPVNPNPSKTNALKAVAVTMACFPPKPIPACIFRQLCFPQFADKKAKLRKLKGAALPGVSRGGLELGPPTRTCQQHFSAGRREGSGAHPCPPHSGPTAGVSPCQALSPLHCPGATLTAGWARRPRLLPSTPKPPIAGADLQRSPLRRGDLQDPASLLHAAK